MYFLALSLHFCLHQLRRDVSTMVTSVVFCAELSSPTWSFYFEIRVHVCGQFDLFASSLIDLKSFWKLLLCIECSWCIPMYLHRKSGFLTASMCFFSRFEKCLDFEWSAWNGLKLHLHNKSLSNWIVCFLEPVYSHTGDTFLVVFSINLSPYCSMLSQNIFFVVSRTITSDLMWWSEIISVLYIQDLLFINSNLPQL